MSLTNPPFFRQCMCIYKDSRNYDRFNHLMQGVLWTALELIRSMETGTPPALALFVQVPESEEKKPTSLRENKAVETVDTETVRTKDLIENTEVDKEVNLQREATNCSDSPEETSKTVDKTTVQVNKYMDWTLEEREHLLQFVTKVFQLNFPHYTSYKHSVHSKLEVGLLTS